MRLGAEEDVVAPIRVVCCPFCTRWLKVEGLSAFETMWMHEWDCSCIALDYTLAVVANA
jgi:hypothetical protein